MIKLMFLSLAVMAMQMPSTAVAQTYPDRAIRLIVPYPPGGSSDVLARSVAQAMGTDLKQAIYVENIGGAGSTIGTAEAARAAPDGYTLLFGYSSGLTMAQGFYPHLGYDSLKSFVPIGSVASFPMVMAASSTLPVSNLKQLVALAKSEPGHLTFATPGKGSSTDLIGEILRTSAGIDIVQVPYKGMAPAWLDVAAGRIDLTWDAIDGVRPMLSAGKVKPLAVTSAQRLTELPDVPTVAEAGFPELQLSVWTALLAPIGTPPAIVSLLETELQKTLAEPEIRKLFEAHGYQMMAGSAASLADLMKHEVPRYGDVIRKANAQVN
jgi:tripartite-type tricarboxylate transporter receptor subunit TctC